MRIVFWGKGDRGTACLRALHAAGRVISLVVVHPSDEHAGVVSVGAAARALGIATIAPEDPNSQETRALLAREAADLFILGGYGKILRQSVIDIPAVMCVNLHGGKLPERRGSSPMNWALINGEPSFTLSIIRVASGVDSGDVILDRTFPIGVHDTIVDLHVVADREFPSMLLEAIDHITSRTVAFRAQDEVRAGYFPLRFPDDGFIVWDMFSAAQVHNRIRALTEPYPGAFTYWRGRKVKLLQSALAETPYYGEPGRVYRITERGLLVCAADRCLWITRATFEHDGTSLGAAIQRYDRLTTVREAVQTVVSASATVPLRALESLGRGTSYAI